MLTRISDLGERVKSRNSRKKLVLAAAQDLYALMAVRDAAAAGLITPVLVGDRPDIVKKAASIGFNLDSVEILHEENLDLAVEKAVRLIHDGYAQILMKGSCGTAQLLKGVLNKEWGLRKGDLLSHFALFEIAAYHKLLAVTDVAINIAPDVKAKEAILNNSVEYLNNMGLAKPKVAVIAAVEKVFDQMPATVDAAILVRRNREGLIQNCIVDGPMALDNAISLESAEHKGIVSEVAGDADLLLMPDIEAGNVFYKTLAFLTDARVASVVLGASAPVVLTSRSDSEDAKYNSLLLATAIDIV
ncbi:MAG: phosphate butyryltransferase [Bacteroidetes bacterium GWF2_49_14]|nr:MAG: phosphate butyryltransferase [Bacteroidetes bacterium GWF2_49_14]HBB91773.1 phosphate butyryltransferase [Bacteroidales bacterium]